MNVFRSLTLIAVVGLAACGVRGAGLAEGTTATLIAENPLPGGGPLTVYAVPTAGPRRLAGTVVAAQSTHLDFHVTTTGQFRLVAETAGQNQLTSNVVTIGPGDTVRWDLTANIVTIGWE